MKLIDAYVQAIEEDDDVKEREEFSSNSTIKNDVVEEIIEALTEIRDNKTSFRSTAEMVQPLFSCVAFWFVIGIRIGKILRDAEIAEAEEHSAE